MTMVQRRPLPLILKVLQMQIAKLKQNSLKEGKKFPKKIPEQYRTLNISEEDFKGNVL